MDSSKRRFIKQTAGAGVIGLTGLAGCLGNGGGSGSGNSDGSNTNTPIQESTSTPTNQSTLTQGSTSTSMESVDAAFVNLYSTASGWVKAHDRAQDAVEEELDWVNVQRQREVAPADVQQVLGGLAEEGYDAIFANATEYKSAVESLSKEYPDIAWFLVSASVKSDRFSVYLSRDYQPAYVAGYVAGLVTKSNLLGFMTAYPYPGTNRKANGFALGAKAANSKAEVILNYSGTWYDPPVERDATSVLINKGADVVYQWSDSSGAMKEVNNNKGVWGVGGGGVAWADAAGDSLLTSVLNTWEGYYIDQLKQIRNGTYEPSFDWWGINRGICDVGDGVDSDDDQWGPEVPPDVMKEANGVRQDIIDDKADIWAGTQYEGKSDDYLHTEMTKPVENIRNKFEE